jgi:predicted P-loop ATPase
LKYDGEVKIAQGASRLSKNWKNKTMLWSELVKRLKITQRTAETVSEYKAMPKPQRDSIKDVGGFVGGTLKNSRRKAENVNDRYLLTLDIDSVPEGEDPWENVELVMGNAAVLYSTHSHTSKAQRLRLVMPLSRAVTAEEYTALARLKAQDIGIDMCDDTTYEAHRLMYWPSTSIDGDYRFETCDGKWINVDEELARYKDWKDTSLWPVSSRKQSIVKKLAKKQGDPAEKKGVVGAFCRVYTIEEAIEKFLSDIYAPSQMPDRYSYIPAASTAGVVIYDEGKFAFSNHASNPTNGILCNAFDLVRIHLFGDKDEETPNETNVVKLPSYKAMSEFAIADEAVRQNIMEQKLADVLPSFEDDDNWRASLTLTAKGKIESTINNVFIIITHDPEICDTFFYDEFKEAPMVCADTPWQAFDTRKTPVWTDVDDAGLRLLLEKKYSIDCVGKIRDAVDLAMLKNKRHPVREYLAGLKWDGICRAESIFIDYLGAEDTEYTREVSKKSLIGAVARIMKPGCKHDHTLVLIGPQGCRKSTTLAKLGKEWYSDSLYTVVGKEAYELLQGTWIIENGELAATRKAELEQIKQFMSKKSDTYREAYARRTKKHPRQCAFFGTTNDTEFLRDVTGNRRFWPVTVTEQGKVLNDGLTSEIVDQIWAEIVVRYEAGEQWHLSNSVETKARDIQLTHTELNGKKGLIENFLSELIPENWDERDLNARRIFWDGTFESEKGTVERQKVCAIEIWCELFNGDPKMYSQAQAREINTILQQISGWKSKPMCQFGKIYGRQRCFVKE